MSAYQIKAVADVATIYLYDMIGIAGRDDGKTSAAFAKDVAKLGKVREIKVRIDSEGGSVFEARRMARTLAEHSAKITVQIDGVCASAATLIACVGSPVTMAEDGVYMIHEPAMESGGTAEDLRKDMECLEVIRATLVDTYHRKTRKPKADILKWVQAETWMDAKEALSRGFVDQIITPMKMAAKANFTNLPYRHIPARLQSAPYTNPSLKKLDANIADMERRLAATKPSATPLLDSVREQLRNMERIVNDRQNRRF